MFATNNSILMQEVIIEICKLLLSMLPEEWNTFEHLFMFASRYT